MQKQVFLIPIMQPRIIKRIEKKVTLVFDSRKEQKKKSHIVCKQERSSLRSITLFACIIYLSHIVDFFFFFCYAAFIL